MCLPFRLDVDCLKPRPAQKGREQGAVLLEVVLALVLFVGAAAILTSGLSSSLDTLDRLRRNTRAADLAVSVLSEVQMGIKSLSVSGPQPFEAPLDQWTWEIVTSPIETEAEEATAFRKIEIIIRHEDPALVYRLGQIVRLDRARSGEAEGLPGVSSF